MLEVWVAHAGVRTRWSKRLLVCGTAAVVGVVGSVVGSTMFGANSHSTKGNLRVDRHVSVRQFNLTRQGEAIDGPELARRLSAQPVASLQLRGASPAQALQRFLEAPRVGSMRGVPQVAHSTITKESPAADAVTFSVDLQLVTAFNETVGLIPRHARGSFRAERDGAQWRVNAESARFSFVFDTPSAIETTTAEWARSQQSCRATRHQWRATLFGDGASERAAQFCGHDGTVRTGAVKEISQRSDIASLVAAFGPQVGRWARAVAVVAPLPMDVVLAPVDGQWLVIGVLRSSEQAVQG